MPDRTVFCVLEEAAELYGSAPALHQPYTEHGKRLLRTVSWAEYRTAAEEISAGLRTLGICKGDVVALDSETRLEFYLADLGIMANGSIAAALYPAYPPKEIIGTIQACDAKAVAIVSSSAEKPDGRRVRIDSTPITRSPTLMGTPRNAR